MGPRQACCCLNLHHSLPWASKLWACWRGTVWGEDHLSPTRGGSGRPRFMSRSGSAQVRTSSPAFPADFAPHHLWVLLSLPAAGRRAAPPSWGPVLPRPAPAPALGWQSFWGECGSLVPREGLVGAGLPGQEASGAGLGGPGLARLLASQKLQGLFSLSPFTILSVPCLPHLVLLDLPPNI